MEASILELFERLVRGAGETLAALDCIEGERELPVELTYQTLHYYALDVAGSLQQLPGAGPGPGLGAPLAPVASGLRRGNDFYVLFLACSFAQLPFVALSTDLAQQDVERKRNQQILTDLKPWVLILHSEEGLRLHLESAPVFVRTVPFKSLLSPNGAGPRPFVRPAVDPRSVLCYQYTGGTTGASRCCAATQQMALWEVVKYKEVVDLKSSDRVLQQHSAYWAASLFGEFDIAWAFGCTLVFAKCSNVQDLADCLARTKVTCAGLVPSVLETLEDKHDLKVVFTWGEALRSRTALSWARRVHLIDLLIASEYWLCLFADWTNFEGQSRTGHATDRPPFQAVSDVAIRLIDENSQEAEKGEMLLSGPFVCPGYTNNLRLNEECFVTDAMRNRWYRTRDVLQRQGHGYTFAGRADDMVKVAGEWVDTREVVDKLRELSGVKEACMHGKAAYIKLEGFEEDVVAKLRRQIPPDYALYLVPSIPRAPTGKVDRKALDVMVGKDFTLKAQSHEVIQQSAHLQLIARWYVFLLPLTFGPGYTFLTAEDHLIAFLWFIVELFMRTLLLTYMFLGLVYELRPLSAYLRYFPFDRVLALVLCAGLLPLWTVPWNGLLLSASSVGAVHAWWRQRLVSWPVVVIINFPRTARQDGLWWYRNLTSRKGLANICDWYNMQRKRNYTEMKQWWDTKMGLIRKCHHCAKEKKSSEGKMDPSDSKWYCNACWDHYHKHWQCPRCNNWTLRGEKWQDQWLCSKCIKIVKMAAPPVPALAVPLLEANHLDTLESPNKRQKFDQDAVAAQPLAMEVVSPSSSTGQSSATVGPAPAAPIAPSHAADAAAGNGLLQTPRGTELRPLVPQFVTAELRAAMAPQLAAPGNGGLAAAGPLPALGALQRSSPEALPSAASVKSPEWLEVEQALGWTFNSLGDHLTGIDSMRFAKLMSTLLRRGKHLPPSAHKCRNLGELLSQITVSPMQSARQEVPGQEWPTWGMMWTSVCGWRFHRHRPIPQSVLRQAVQDLISRHVALRCVMADPMELFHQIQAALSILHLWRVSSPFFASSCLSSLCSWALKNAWPRVKSVQPKVEDVLTFLTPAESFERADALISRKDPFDPPFQLRVCPVSTGGLVMQLRLTHMFSDGFCVVPLLHDLAKLVADQEQLQLGARQITPLPPLPVSFEILKGRLFRTMEGDNSLADTVTPAHFDPNSWSSSVRSELLNMSPMLVTHVKRAATKLAVPDEILLLSAIGISMAKLHQQGAQTLHVIAPQRDEPCASDLIGLFADHRRLEVPIEGLHYAGVALALNVVVKERLWRQPPVIGQGSAPFVNFMWTDFEEPEGFKPIVAQKGKDLSSCSPIQVVVVQPDRDCWRIICTFKTELYTVDQMERFYGYLVEAVRCLIEAPLTPVDAASAG